MAKRKKAKKTSHRRRRVSGVALNANSPIVQYGSIAAGYFLADTINAPLSKLTGSLDPKIVAAIEAVGGFLIRKKMKGVAGAVAGGVLMGAGLKNGLKAFGVVSGLPVVSGYRDVRTINGLPNATQQKRIQGVAQGQSQAVSVISGIDTYSAYTDHD